MLILLISFMATAHSTLCHTVFRFEDPVAILRPEMDVQGDLRDAGLAQYKDQILDHSKGLFTIHQIAGGDIAIPEGSVILGLNKLDVVDVIVQLSRNLKFKSFADQYPQQNIDSQTNRNHTEEFLNFLIQSDRSIVFLVPPNLMSFDPNGVTKREMEWLLADNTRLKNVYFVFGAYKFGEKWQEQLVDFSKLNPDFNFWELYNAILEGRPYSDPTKQLEPSL